MSVLIEKKKNIMWCSILYEVHLQHKGYKFTSLNYTTQMNFSSTKTKTAQNKEELDKVKKKKTEANRRKQKWERHIKMGLHLVSLCFACRLFEDCERDSWEPLQWCYWCWQTMKHLIAPSFSGGRNGWIVLLSPSSAAMKAPSMILFNVPSGPGLALSEMGH